MEQGGLSYPDLLLPLALGLLTGLRGPRHTLTAALALSLAWPTGGLLGTKLDHPSWTPFVTAAITVALGLLIALNRDLPRWTTALAAAIAGLAFGFASAPRVWSETPGATFAATGVAMALLTLPPAGAAMAARPDWSKIVVRVAGSWIAAIGLLLIGWAAKT
jgi:hydrogenase/urease accessory protein HupE